MKRFETSLQLIALLTREYLAIHHRSNHYTGHHHLRADRSDTVSDKPERRQVLLPSSQAQAAT